MRLGLRRLWSLQTLQTMSLRAVDIPNKYFESAHAYDHGFKTAQELRKYVADPRNDLTHEFLDYAESKGDWCYAITDGDVLASYGWYSAHPTRFIKGLVIEVDEGDIYMYRGYTIQGYRGRRLHGFGMAQACRAFTQKGYSRLVSYVDAKNVSSSRSAGKLGYENRACIYVLRVVGMNFVWADYPHDRALYVRQSERDTLRKSASVGPTTRAVAGSRPSPSAAS
ncbi:MAG: hypothetical protein R3282_03335, partial [Rhodothermales bacterium]|nr:hypothetical protein [Rhodothermales bacterium]